MGLELARAWVRIRADASQLKGDFSNAQKVAIDQSRKISNVINQNITVRTSSLGLQLKRLLAGIGVGALAKEMFGLAASLETTTTSMRVMLGSAEKAKNIISEIRALALQSPFTFEELTLNTRQLLAYGIASKDLIKTVKALAGVVAATDADFGRLALAYGQVRSKGRLQAQEIRQFTEATVPLVQLLAADMGKSAGEVLKMVEEGKVGFSAVEKVIFSLTEGTGRYVGILTEMSTTLKGSFNILRNYLKFILTDLGTALMPILKGVINIAIAIGERLRGMFENVQGPLIQWANAVADVLNTVSKNIGLVWKLMQTQFSLSIQLMQDNWVTFLNNLPKIAVTVTQAMTEAFIGFGKSLIHILLRSLDFITTFASKADNIMKDVFLGEEFSDAVAKRLGHALEEVMSRSSPDVLKEAQVTASRIAEIMRAGMQNLQPIEVRSEEGRRLQRERDTLAAEFAAALEQTRQARIAAANVPDQERAELEPDTGMPEKATKKGRAGSNMVGIAELGRQIQQELLDKEEQHRNRVERFWNENNRQNQAILGALQETNDKWDKLPDFGGLV